MTALTVTSLVLGWVLAALGFVCFWAAEDQGRDLRRRLDLTRAQRDRYAWLYRGKVREVAVLLEHVGDDEREAAEYAAAECPIYFDTAAQRSLDWLDETTAWGER